MQTPIRDADPPRPAPQERCRQHFGIACPGDEGLTALSAGLASAAAAAAKAALAVPRTSRSSIKVHRIPAPGGWTGGPSPTCEHRGLFVLFLPNPGSQEPALDLLPTPAWESSFF